jgi:hypothetical protein
MPKAKTKSKRVAPRPRAKSRANPVLITEEFKREAMRAYCEWLFMEHRLLCDELEPDYHPSGRWSPVNSASHAFHFPNSDGFKGWESSPPSSRAIPMMRALGIDVAKHLAQDKRAQRKLDRQNASISGRAS